MIAPALAMAMTLPLSAASVQDYVTAHDVETVEDFLTALPQSMQGSFALIHASRSLQEATPARPRQILYGPDARFLVAVGSVAGDSRAAEVEFAEFKPDDGLYHYGTVRFPAGKPGTVATDDQHCNVCHGIPARPIWGEYPDWSGAYGDDQGAIDASLQAGFAGFAAAAPSDPRYRNLRFAAGAGGTTFLLTDRVYPYANTDFNHELGNTYALGVMTRMQAHQDYAHLRWAALAASPALGCIGSDAWFDVTSWLAAAYAQAGGQPHPADADAYVEAMLLSGIDPLGDLSLETMVGATAGTGGLWQTGAYQLQEAIAFQLLVAAMADDPTLAQMFVSEKDTIDDIERHALLTGEARAEALKSSYAWFDFFDVFAPMQSKADRLEAVCARLAAHLKD